MEKHFSKNMPRKNSEKSITPAIQNASKSYENE
jgi:hypothetical protein